MSTHSCVLAPQLKDALSIAEGGKCSPYLYDLDDADKFLLGVNDQGETEDLPRNRQGRALLGDPRDDVHLIIRFVDAPKLESVRLFARECMHRR